jgi:hypothetical protein
VDSVSVYCTARTLGVITCTRLINLFSFIFLLSSHPSFRFEVLSAVALKIPALWAVSPYSPLDINDI